LKTAVKEIEISEQKFTEKCNMRLSDFIKNCKEILSKYGDLNVVYCPDDSGSFFKRINYDPTVGVVVEIEGEFEFTSLDFIKNNPEKCLHLVGKTPNIVCIN
jgi:predicted RNA-binding protein